MPKIEENCAACGKFLSRYVKPSRMEKRKRFFCDRSCHATFFRTSGNPMNNAVSAKKQSSSRILMFKQHPEKREIASKIMRDAWANGDYDGVRVGQCSWHTYTKKDGHTIKLQGTWELMYAKWMDDNGVVFETHIGRLPYTDDNNIERSYYPDFRITDGSYIDVKNPYYKKLHARKLELVSKQNAVVIRIINKEELERLMLI